MKLISTLFFICLLQLSFSQNSQSSTEQSHFSILIENISIEPGVSEELLLNLESKGVYSFKLSQCFVLPADYSVLIKDVLSGNSFLLNYGDPHSFSVNRAMTKKFSVQLIQTPLSVSCP